MAFSVTATSTNLFCPSLVLGTLEEALAEDPNRKCFRLIGGVLTERTVKEVVPALKTNRDGVCISFILRRTSSHILYSDHKRCINPWFPVQDQRTGV
jgi:hypothetical protein